MTTELSLALAEKLLSMLPGFILRKYYTEARLKDAIDIETRATNPIIFTLNSHIPDLEAYFTITNFTNLTWKLHDFSAEVWIGQPVAMAICYDKPDITKRKKTNVYTKCFLSENQVKRLEEEKKKGNARARICIYTYLESKLGLRKFTRTIEASQVIIQ